MRAADSLQVGGWVPLGITIKMYVFDLIVNESLIFQIVKLDMRFFFLKKIKIKKTLQKSDVSLGAIIMNACGKTSLVTTLVT